MRSFPCLPGLSGRCVDSLLEQAPEPSSYCSLPRPGLYSRHSSAALGFQAQILHRSLRRNSRPSSWSDLPTPHRPSGPCSGPSRSCQRLAQPSSVSLISNSLALSSLLLKNLSIFLARGTSGRCFWRNVSASEGLKYDPGHYRPGQEQKGAKRCPSPSHQRCMKMSQVWLILFSQLYPLEFTEPCRIGLSEAVRNGSLICGQGIGARKLIKREATPGRVAE